MKVFELFEGLDKRGNEIEWHRDALLRQTDPLFGLYDRFGKLVRPHLTRKAADALRNREDLVKKHGKLFLKKM